MTLRRVAWLGPAPSDDYGVPYAATLLVKELAQRGVEVDCFVTGPLTAMPHSLRVAANVRFFCETLSWKWGQWYSRRPLMAFVTGQLARVPAQRRLVQRLNKMHAVQPYDAVYQFSQIELFQTRSLLHTLPPLVIHPEVHAAGELIWHRREAQLVRQCEPGFRRFAVRAMLRFRSEMQRRDIALARLVIAPSYRFAKCLTDDYGLPDRKIRVVPNPIDLERFAPRPAARDLSREPVTLLFVSRMSVRKGVEMVVDLSHRLTDLSGRVRMLLVGGQTLWSDYRPLLLKLNRKIATYAGPLLPERLPDVYRSSDVLVQPSRYEPFALTVGEALACGVPVVASDEVGATEGVDRRCCMVFPSGDAAALESAVRDLVHRMDSAECHSIRELARKEAERLFAPKVVSASLLGYLAELEPEAHPTERVLSTA